MLPIVPAPASGKYKGLYSSTAAYLAKDIVVDAQGVLWMSNFDRTVGVWPASPMEGLGSDTFKRLVGKDRGPFSFGLAYAAGDVVFDSSASIGTAAGWYRNITPHVSGNAPDPSGWQFVGGKDRVFASNTVIAPASAGAPTVGEIGTFATFGAHTDVMVYYTGTDTGTDSPTHVFHIDSAGAVTLLMGPVAGLAFRGTFDRTTAPTVMLANSIYLFDLNPSTGQTATRLPPATGSGARIILAINGLAQPVIVRAPVGQNLNDVTDGSISANLSTYGHTLRLDFIDIGVNSWHGVVLKTDAETYTELAYGRIALSALQNGPSNAAALVLLNTSELDSGGVVEIANNGLRVPASGGLHRVVASLHTDDLDDDGAGLFVLSDGVPIKTRIANGLATGTTGIDTITLSFLHMFSGGELVTMQATTSGAETWEIDQGSYLEIQQQPTAVRPSVVTNPSAIVETVVQTAHGFIVGDAVAHDGTAWIKARADNANTLCQGIVIDVAALNAFTVCTFGKVAVAAHGLTVGQHYWLSQATAGLITVTQPSSGIIQGALHVRDANTLFVNIGTAISI